MGNAAIKIQNDNMVEISISSALTDRQIDIRAKKYLDLDAKIKELTAQRDALKEELLEAGTRATAHFSVTVTTYSQSRFDSKAFGKDHKNLYEAYRKPVSCTKFEVKAV